MGTMTIDFIGLFLFNNTTFGKRVAVIHASREGVEHEGTPLRPHRAFFNATGQTTVDWPQNAFGYDLTGVIEFEATAPLVDPGDRWILPKFGDGCPSFEPGSFFDEPAPSKTHAIIVIAGGELCAWRVRSEDRLGAIHTRLTFTNESGFAITRNDGKRIVFDMTQDATITFENSEAPPPSTDDKDWYWYYVATGLRCKADPKNPSVEPPCLPPVGLPSSLSLGCSNSNWP